MWQIGDIVRVRDDLIVDKKYEDWYFIDDMELYKGREFVVEDVEIEDDIRVYRLRDVKHWGFTAPMLEDVLPPINLQTFSDFLLEDSVSLWEE